MDKSGSVSPPHRVLKILIWLVRAFVLEASERKTHLILNTFLNTAVCMMHNDEVMYLFVSM